MTNKCNCCGTAIKNVFYFEGKAYGSTCIGYVSGAVPFIPYMQAYGVNSIEEAQKIFEANQDAAKTKVAEWEVLQESRKAQGNANGEIYEMVVNHISQLQETDKFAGYFASWKNTLEETALENLTEKQQQVLSEVYAQISKFNGTKGKLDNIAFDYGVKTFGWEESKYDVALAKIKKMKFTELQELAIKLNVDEAADCLDNRSDKKYLRESLVENLDKVVEVI